MEEHPRTLIGGEFDCAVIMSAQWKSQFPLFHGFFAIFLIACFKTETTPLRTPIGWPCPVNLTMSTDVQRNFEPV